MDFRPYERKPFSVLAVEVTAENIAEVATLTGTLKTKPDGTPYIHVNPELCPVIEKIFVGYWLTKMGSNIRCYSAKAFKGQFRLKQNAQARAAEEKAEPVFDRMEQPDVV